jgi:hypothetical protein
MKLRLLLVLLFVAQGSAICAAESSFYIGKWILHVEGNVSCKDLDLRQSMHRLECEGRKKLVTREDTFEFSPTHMTIGVSGIYSDPAPYKVLTDSGNALLIEMVADKDKTVTFELIRKDDELCIRFQGELLCMKRAK